MKTWGNRVQNDHPGLTFRQLVERGLWPEHGRDYVAADANLLPDEIRELELTGMVSVTIRVAGCALPVVVRIRDWQRWDDWQGGKAPVVEHGEQ